MTGMCFTAMTVMWFAVMSEESTAKSKTPGSKCEPGAPGGFLAHGFPEDLRTGIRKVGRDSSTAQADSFAGAKEEEKRRLAALGMTVVCYAMRNVDGAGVGSF